MVLLAIVEFLISFAKPIIQLCRCTNTAAAAKSYPPNDPHEVTFPPSQQSRASPYNHKLANTDTSISILGIRIYRDISGTNSSSAEFGGRPSYNNPLTSPQNSANPPNTILVNHPRPLHIVIYLVHSSTYSKRPRKHLRPAPSAAQAGGRAPHAPRRRAANRRRAHPSHRPRARELCAGALPPQRRVRRGVRARLVRERRRRRRRVGVCRLQARGRREAQAARCAARARPAVRRGGRPARGAPRCRRRARRPRPGARNQGRAAPRGRPLGRAGARRAASRTRGSSRRQRLAAAGVVGAGVARRRRRGRGDRRAGAALAGGQRGGVRISRGARRAGRRAAARRRCSTRRRRRRARSAAPRRRRGPPLAAAAHPPRRGPLHAGRARAPPRHVFTVPRCGHGLLRAAVPSGDGAAPGHHRGRPRTPLARYRAAAAGARTGAGGAGGGLDRAGGRAGGASVRGAARCRRVRGGGGARAGIGLECAAAAEGLGGRQEGLGCAREGGGEGGVEGA